MAYGACDSKDAQYARRITYVIDAEGHIEKAIEKVDPQSHPETLLASL